MAPDGAVVEMSYGSSMIGRAEPKSVAQRLDKVEIFGLTRVVLPAAPPPRPGTVPGEWTLALAGFPARSTARRIGRRTRIVGAGNQR